MTYRSRKRMVATKKKAGRNLPARLLMLAAIGVLCGLMYLSLWTDCFTVREIQFLGSRNLPADSLDAVKQGFIGNNLLTMSLSLLRERILRIPEVRNVTFKKRFLHRLDCYIHQREPVALMIARGVTEIDADGFAIPRRSHGGEVDLPVITGIRGEELGEDGGSEKVLTALQVLDLLKSFGFSPADELSEIHCDGDDIELIWMSTGTLIRLGEGRYLEKIRKLKAVYRALSERERFPGLIDLRFDRQVVIR